MKKILLIILFINQIIYSQEKNVLVLDFETKSPINQVQVFYKQLNEGSVTNKDGKTKISVQNEDLSVIHLIMINK